MFLMISIGLKYWLLKYKISILLKHGNRYNLVFVLTLKLAIAQCSLQIQQYELNYMYSKLNKNTFGVLLGYCPEWM